MLAPKTVAIARALSSNMKSRLDQELARRGLVTSRSQAESYIKLGKVKVDGEIANKSGRFVDSRNKIELISDEQYVSRAGLKLSSVAKILKLDFNEKVVLDVGSSTGGFTDYALKHGAKKVIAVDVGSNQLHPSLRGHALIELHEQTDIRHYVTASLSSEGDKSSIDIIVIDVSFISLRDILPQLSQLMSTGSQIIAMVKPQFEAGKEQVNKGIIKNERVRRDILKEFEDWARKLFIIVDKADSEVAGTKGNRERFYLLRKTK